MIFHSRNKHCGSISALMANSKKKRSENNLGRKGVASKYNNVATNQNTNVACILEAGKIVEKETIWTLSTGCYSEASGALAVPFNEHISKSQLWRFNIFLPFKRKIFSSQLMLAPNSNYSTIMWNMHNESNVLSSNRALFAIFYEILIQCELFDQESMER